MINDLKSISGNNIKYNEETDMIQVIYNGEWQDVMSANMSNLILFENGDISDITGGWQITASTAQYNTSTCSINSSIDIGYLVSNYGVDFNTLILMTKKKLDIIY